MSELLGWTRLAVGIVFGVANLALTVWFFTWIMGMVGRGMGMFDNPTLARYATSPKLLLRRVWCSHRTVVRGRDPYGRLFTACARCAKDVNAGKERWERR